MIVRIILVRIVLIIQVGGFYFCRGASAGPTAAAEQPPGKFTYTDTNTTSN